MREQRAKEYLLTIYTLQLDGPVRAAYVAREMNLSKASVSNAMKALAADGYLSVDEDRAIRLTEAGERLAHVSIHETVRRGRNVHERFQTVLTQHEGALREAGRRGELRRLERDRSACVLEALRILSARYYCVRAVDVSQFLHRSGASIRGKLRQLELRGYVMAGEESVYTLTPEGAELAELLYADHAPLRERLVAGGMSAGQAEQEAAARED